MLSLGRLSVRVGESEEKRSVIEGVLEELVWQIMMLPDSFLFCLVLFRRPFFHVPSRWNCPYLYKSVIHYFVF